LWAMQSGGMSEHDALRAATIVGAEAIGLGRDPGSPDGGQPPDPLVLAGNPLDTTRNTTTVRYGLKNGRQYDGSTLDAPWPGARPAAEEPWRNSSPNVGTGVRGGVR